MTDKQSDTDGRSATEKVFNTVELLDMILTFARRLCCPKHILPLQRVNKTFYHHVNGDTEVGKNLHLTPRLSGKRSLYPLMDVYLGPVKVERQEKYRLLIINARPRTEAAPPSWKRMLLIQPPWHTAKIYDRNPIIQKKSYLEDLHGTGEAGITVGDLENAVKRLMALLKEERAVVYYNVAEDELEVDFTDGWGHAQMRNRVRSVGQN